MQQGLDAEPCIFVQKNFAGFSGEGTTILTRQRRTIVITQVFDDLHRGALRVGRERPHDTLDPVIGRVELQSTQRQFKIATAQLIDHCRVQRGTEVQHILRLVKLQAKDLVSDEVDLVLGGHLPHADSAALDRCLGLLGACEKCVETLTAKRYKPLGFALLRSFILCLHGQFLFERCALLGVGCTATDSGGTRQRRRRPHRDFSLLGFTILPLQVPHLGLRLRGHVGLDPLERFFCTLLRHAREELALCRADRLVTCGQGAGFGFEGLLVLEPLVIQRGVGNDELERVNGALEPREVHLRVFSGGLPLLTLFDRPGL